MQELPMPVLSAPSMRQHTSAYVSIRQHTSACVSIRQHTSAYVSLRPHRYARGACLYSAREVKMRYGSDTPCSRSSMSTPSIRHHTSAYVSIRQHTAAFVSIRQQVAGEHTDVTVGAAQHKLVRRTLPRNRCDTQHTSAYVSIRQHTSAYVVDLGINIVVCGRIYSSVRTHQRCARLQQR